MEEAPSKQMGGYHLDVDLSRTVVSLLRLRPRNKSCWSNAMRAFDFFRKGEAHYVEGWCDNLWHGWVQTNDGRVVDTTPIYMENPGRCYVPFRLYTHGDLADAFAVRPELPITRELQAMRIVTERRFNPNNGD